MTPVPTATAPAAHDPTGRGVRRRPQARRGSPRHGPRRPHRRPRRLRAAPSEAASSACRPRVPRRACSRVAPGIGTVHGVRRPLLAAVARGFRHETRHDRPTTLLFIADRLFHEPHLEARWFAFGLLERTLAADPERTWQLLRRAAREAGDWITVDDLAHPYGIGIDAEPYRWAELEQLVYSPSRWERRLIGSTIATMTHGNRRTGREPGCSSRRRSACSKRSWATPSRTSRRRSPGRIDRWPSAIRRRPPSALRREADIAIADDDGHRAWVVRDSLVQARPGRRR